MCEVLSLPALSIPEFHQVPKLAVFKIFFLNLTTFKESKALYGVDSFAVPRVRVFIERF